MLPLQYNIAFSYLLTVADAAVNGSPFSAEMMADAPLWRRLMTVPNMLGLAAYFSLLLLGFWAIKVLADDDGSKLMYCRLVGLCHALR